MERKTIRKESVLSGIVGVLLFAISLATNAQVRIPEGYSVLRGYPFVLCCDEDSAPELEMPDSLFNALATGVQFEVNSVEIDRKSEFFTLYYDRLLPLLRAQRLYPVKMYIRGAASPDGPYENNRRLGMHRSQNLMRILNESLFLSHNTIDGKVINEDYAYLVDLMHEANDPDAEAVHALMVESKWDEPTCKLALQKMNDGRVWKRLVKDYFPRLRTARIVLCVAHMPDAPKTSYLKGKTDTIYVRDTVYVNHTTVVNNTNYMNGQYGDGTTTMRYMRVEDGGTGSAYDGDTIKHHPLFALKTNLLFDVLTALNASVEVPIGHHWSLSAEVVWPWWVDKKNQWCLQMGNVGLEARYYFLNSRWHSTHAAWRKEGNRPLTGFFLGLHADGAYYDFEWKGSGRQGEVLAAGVTLGYQKRISRYFNMEFSLGLGGAHHKYRTYDATEAGDHLWKQNTYTNKWYIGPTKAKISLVWMLYSKCGKKCQKGGEK